MTVERGNLPNSERCGGSRLMAGDNTYTITPPLRREWPLTCDGLPAPQTNRPPYCSVMRTASATSVATRDICCRYYLRGLVTGYAMARSTVPGILRRRLNSLPDLRVGRRMYLLMRYPRGQ